MAELWGRCHDAVIARIQGLPLKGDIASRVYKQKLPDTGPVVLPAILVTIENCIEGVSLFDTGNDETGWPVAVHVYDRQDWKDQAGLPNWQDWRTVLSGAFRARPLPGVPEVWRMDVRPASTLERKGYQLAVGSLVVLCKCITPRITY